MIKTDYFYKLYCFEVGAIEVKRCICAIVLLICMLVSFTGCETEKPQETLPSVTEEAKWQPYDGDTDAYIYYYDRGLNRLWEEDLLYMADLYLENHALLTPEESRVSFRNGVVREGYYTDEMYRPEIREAFLAVFNETVPQLASMTKAEFLLSAQKMLATLSDAHAYLDFPYGERFPCSVICDDGGFYVVGISHGRTKELLFSHLRSINGVAIESVIDALRPFIPYENEYCLLDQLATPGYKEALFSAELLKLAGVLQEKDKAEFVFETQDGTLHAVELETVSYYDTSHLWASGVYPYDSPMFKNEGKDYWYEMLEGVPYLRIDSFHIDESDLGNQTLLEVGNALFAEVRDMGGVSELIVDLRGNGGGSQQLGYHQVVSVLDRMKLETIYVLIDAGSFSQSVIFATYMKQDLENVVLVGTPAGQSPNFFGALDSYTMPNTETEFVLPTEWWKGWEDYAYDALMPDIVIEQTLQDYRENCDAVLSYVLDKIKE